MPKNNPHIVFLCAYPQPFLTSGIKQLVEQYNADVMVVHWPLPADNPMPMMAASDRVNFLDKGTLSKGALDKYINEFAPDMIYAAGWMDKDYMALARKYKNAGRITVMGMDTQWKGLLRQKINCLTSPYRLKTAFNYAWVPGPLQREYALRLGFDEKQILNYLCAPDTALFTNAYGKYLAKKTVQMPKAFLYVGRLVDHKFGPLLRSFTALREQERKGWKLIVAGKGEMESLPEMKLDSIVYKGFLQQDKLVELVGDAGVFCLPSREEPWGTVIQEFAAAGMPVLASTQCGASHVYVKSGVTGDLRDGNNTDDVKQGLLKMINTSDNELLKMGEEGMMLASQHNSRTWANELMSVLTR